MQFKAVILSAAVLGFSGLAAADESQIPALVAQLPTCGTSCLLTAVTATDCSVTDYECQCANTDAITTAVDPCLKENCTSDEVTQVQDISAKICNALGASTSATGSAASASTTATSTSGSSGSSTTTGSASSATESTNAAGKVGALRWMGTAALLGAFAL